MVAALATGVQEWWPQLPSASIHHGRRATRAYYRLMVNRALPAGEQQIGYRRNSTAAEAFEHGRKIGLGMKPDAERYIDQRQAKL